MVSIIVLTYLLNKTNPKNHYKKVTRVTLLLRLCVVAVVDRHVFVGVWRVGVFFYYLVEFVVDE